MGRRHVEAWGVAIFALYFLPVRRVSNGKFIRERVSFDRLLSGEDSAAQGSRWANPGPALSVNEVTIPEILELLGYQTAMNGKWDLHGKTKR